MYELIYKPHAHLSSKENPDSANSSGFAQKPLVFGVPKMRSIFVHSSMQLRLHVTSDIHFISEEFRSNVMLQNKSNLEIFRLPCLFLRK